MPTIINNQVNQNLITEIVDNIRGSRLGPSLQLIEWLNNNRLYFGIGNFSQWSNQHGTGIEDANPPKPFLHHDNLYQPQFFKLARFSQLALPLTYFPDQSLCLKIIDPQFYYGENFTDPDYSEQPLMVIDRAKVDELSTEQSEYFVDYFFEHFYVELELNPDDFINYPGETFRELALYFEPKTEDSFQGQVNIAADQLAKVKSPLLLSYFSPQAIETNKSFIFSFVIQFPLFDFFLEPTQL